MLKRSFFQRINAQLVAGVSFLLLSFSVQSADYVAIQGNTFFSVLSGSELKDSAKVSDFYMRSTPVTNAEFLAFVQKNPKWQRDKIPTIFAESSYLQAWANAEDIGSGLQKERAVTNVSWFAAQAFCASEHARLPSWYEWELVAAADEHRADARSDPQWRARILSWYSAPSDATSNQINSVPNYYGVAHMHGVIWEWVSDFNALLLSADSRNQGDPDKLKFCGAGAISLQNKENYAILMRVALLSSLTGASTTANLGFRCARDVNAEMQIQKNKSKK